MTSEERKAARTKIAHLLGMIERDDYPSTLLELNDVKNKEEAAAAIKRLEAAGVIVPSMSIQEKEKTPIKISDAEKARLAKRVFNSVRARARDLGDKNIGVALVRLMGAILNGITLDIEGFSDHALGPMYALLLDAFDPKDAGIDPQIEQLYSHIRFVL